MQTPLLKTSNSDHVYKYALKNISLHIDIDVAGKAIIGYFCQLY